MTERLPLRKRPARRIRPRLRARVGNYPINPSETPTRIKSREWGCLPLGALLLSIPTEGVLVFAAIKTENPDLIFAAALGVLVVTGLWGMNTLNE